MSTSKGLEWFGGFYFTLKGIRMDSILAASGSLDLIVTNKSSIKLDV